jgi:Tfp pilus assembly protein FimT
MVIPTLVTVVQNYRVVGDARGIAAQLSLARMRAASEFTQARLNFNTSANTYQLEVWSKSASAFQIEGPVQTLSNRDTFGYGAIATPAGGQTTIAQTQYITFNSRGVSINGAGVPIGTAAIYIINNNGLCLAVTASIAGQPATYEWTGAAWSGL